MRSTFVVARREMAEKRFVFVAAAAFAVLSVLIPLTVRMHGSFREALTFSSLILAASFSLGLAAILGATIVGRELTENRLSFYFARPITGPAVWFGKFLAAAVLILASFVIIVAPAVAGGARVVTQWTDNPAMFAGADALAAIIVFLLAHVLGTMIRSRSAWIALDFVCAAATGAAVFAMLRLPLAAQARTITVVASVALGVGFLFALLGACTWQVAKGRTNRLQNHRALSRFLWPAVTLAVLAVSSYLLWALEASPHTLTDIRVQGAHDGWLLINGKASYRGDYRPTFLINTDGRSVRILAPPWFGMAFSDDGRTAVWFRPKTAMSPTAELIACRLGDPHPHAEPTGIETSMGQLGVSPDGTRVFIGNDSVTIYELGTGRSLGSFHLDLAQNSGRRLDFISRDVVRIIGNVGPAPHTREVYEYDLRTRMLRRTAAFEDRVLSVSRDDTSMLLSRPNLLTLADARSGAPLARIEGLWQRAAFLRDGSILAVRQEGAIVTAGHFTAGGASLGEVRGSGFRDTHVSGGDEHRAIVQVRLACAAGPNCGSWTPAVVDFARGTMKVPDPALRIAIFDPTRALPDEILCTTESGVVSWNMTTGSKRLFAGN